MTSLLDLLIPAASAHEKWFVSASAYGVPEFYKTWNAVTVAGLVAVAVVSVAGYLLDYWFEMSPTYEKFEVRIHRLRDYAAGALAVLTAILLLWSAYRGVLLADNFVLPAGTVGRMFRIIEGVVGLLFLIGLFTPVAAIGLLGLYAGTFIFYPFPEQLDYLIFAGIAIFLFFFSRGRFSLDWFLGKPIFSTPENRKRAYLALRLVTGASFIILAIGKWQDPGLHLALMDKYPSFNPYVLLGDIGIRMTREMYVFALFLNELTVGIFVAFGFLTRVGAVFVALLFIGSSLFLGPYELIGHGPILGVLLVLFVYGDKYHKPVLLPADAPE